MENLQQISDLIKNSKIYNRLSSETIDRIVEMNFGKYGNKDFEKQSKNLLHQIWGAYFTTLPNYNKLINKFDLANPQTSLQNFSIIHTSTKERLKYANEIYSIILNITNPKSIFDYACGFNPLLFLSYNLDSEIVYKSYDIDKNEIDFMNSIFLLVKKTNFTANVCDLFNYIPMKGDVSFFFKCLPVLEQQKKNYSFELISKVATKFIVVSFPTKSISGKEKGMKDFYSSSFESFLNSNNYSFSVYNFSNEIYYIITNKPENII